MFWSKSHPIEGITTHSRLAGRYQIETDTVGVMDLQIFEEKEIGKIKMQFYPFESHQGDPCTNVVKQFNIFFNKSRIFFSWV